MVDCVTVELAVACDFSRSESGSGSFAKIWFALLVKSANSFLRLLTLKQIAGGVVDRAKFASTDLTAVNHHLAPFAVAIYPINCLIAPFWSSFLRDISRSRSP